MTLAELKAILASDMLTDWQKETEASDEVLQGFLDGGIPEEWARRFAAVFRSMPVSRWPKLLRPPKLRLPHAHAERSMSGSKMELRNAEAKSTRVKIAATMTEQETPARKAILDANVTPQEIANELGVGRSTVQAWIDGTRSIPEAHVEALAKPYYSRRAISPRVWKKRQ